MGPLAWVERERFVKRYVSEMSRGVNATGVDHFCQEKGIGLDAVLLYMYGCVGQTGRLELMDCLGWSNKPSFREKHSRMVLETIFELGEAKRQSPKKLWSYLGQLGQKHLKDIMKESRPLSREYDLAAKELREWVEKCEKRKKILQDQSVAQSYI